MPASESGSSHDTTIATVISHMLVFFAIVCSSIWLLLLLCFFINMKNVLEEINIYPL